MNRKKMTPENNERLEMTIGNRLKEKEKINIRKEDIEVEM